VASENVLAPLPYTAVGLSAARAVGPAIRTETARQSINILTFLIQTPLQFSIFILKNSGSNKKIGGDC
jgi:hypothetical protein